MAGVGLASARTLPPGGAGGGCWRRPEVGEGPAPAMAAAGGAGWRLPGRVLELVFSYLELRELRSCALVCKLWHRVLHGDENSEVWRSLAARCLAEEALRTDVLCNVPTYKGKVSGARRSRLGVAAGQPPPGSLEQAAAAPSGAGRAARPGVALAASGVTWRRWWGTCNSRQGQGEPRHPGFHRHQPCSGFVGVLGAVHPGMLGVAACSCLWGRLKGP